VALSLSKLNRTGGAKRDGWAGIALVSG